MTKFYSDYNSTNSQGYLNRLLNKVNGSQFHLAKLRRTSEKQIKINKM